MVSVGSAVVVETLARGDWVPALVPVTLDRPAAGPGTVDYATADGTALAALRARDYQPASGVVAFTSVADNLVSGDTNGRPDLFVRGPFT